MLLHPVLHRFITEARVREIRRHGRGHSDDGVHYPPITIRRARFEDARALAQLAALASADVPHPPVLVAESEGRLCAAHSISAGSLITDPYDHGGHAAELLALRVAQLRVQPI